MEFEDHMKELCPILHKEKRGDALLKDRGITHPRPSLPRSLGPPSGHSILQSASRPRASPRKWQGLSSASQADAASDWVCPPPKQGTEMQDASYWTCVCLKCKRSIWVQDCSSGIDTSKVKFTKTWEFLYLSKTTKKQKKEILLSVLLLVAEPQLCIFVNALYMVISVWQILRKAALYSHMNSDLIFFFFCILCKNVWI